MILDPHETEQSELRGGVSPWQIGLVRPARKAIVENIRCEVLIVGAGITGSLVAEHLTGLGHKVCIVDRERPGFGSTAASTAMLQWEIDSSLSELAQLYGFERAADVYRRSLAAVSGLQTLIHSLQLASAFRGRNSLYLAANEIGATALLEEHELRKRAGLPGTFLDYRTLLSEFELQREAAILSPGSADADPLRLSHALLSISRSRGALLFDAEARQYHSNSQSVTVEFEDGRLVEARSVVLATGYLMPDFMQSESHQTASSWAIATPPQLPGQVWRDGALIWEASKDYLYARTTVDNRIVIGGEDDDQIVEPAARDGLMPEKAKTLLKKLHALWPKAEAAADFVWSGAFGKTTDGLPLIGPVPGHPRLFAAYGYGGNGITFSFLASRMIGELIAGRYKPWFDSFAIDR